MTGNPTSTDLVYDVLVDTDVANPTFTNTDNDTAGFTVTQSLLTTQVTEGLVTDSFTVVLTAQPDSDVVASIASSDATAATVSASSITFTTANWNTPQTITVTAPQDSDVVAETPSITIAIVDASSDNNFDPLADQYVFPVVTENDTAALTLSTASLTMDENLGTGNFTAVLAAQPQSNVVVNVTSSNTSEALVSPATLTFTPANWNVAQTVTVSAINDNTATSDIATINLAINDATSDDSFDSIIDKTVSVTLTNDDTAGFTTVQSGGSTGVIEAGVSDAFTVVLTAQPTSDVVISAISDDVTAATVSPATLTFTSVNWNVAQTLTVASPDDVDLISETPTITLAVLDGSSDNTFDSVVDQSVSIAVTDNDSADVLVSPSGVTVAENGGTAQFTVVLGAQPASDVVLTVASSASSVATVSASTLSFTSANWNTAQTVTVTGVNNSTLAPGAANITVAVSDIASDNNYDAVSDKTVTVISTNDDTA